mgnify:FL=1
MESMIKKIIDVSMMGEVLTNGGWLVCLLLVIFQTFMLYWYDEDKSLVKCFIYAVGTNVVAIILLTMFSFLVFNFC